MLRLSQVAADTHRKQIIEKLINHCVNVCNKNDAIMRASDGLNDKLGSNKENLLDNAD